MIINHSHKHFLRPWIRTASFTDVLDCFLINWPFDDFVPGKKLCDVLLSREVIRVLESGVMSLQLVHQLLGQFPAHALSLKLFLFGITL